MICEGWEGGTVDGKYPLLEWLSGWTDRCVFLTVRQGTQKANIKLIQAGGADADSVLLNWERAKELSHPSLVQLMETGRYTIQGTEVVYLVTELAETFLSGIIPRKALSPSDAKVILGPVVEALEFLHGKGLVHGNVRPSNIISVGERWKLAADEMLGSGAARKPERKQDAYDAPETAEGQLSSSADLWSLGMIVVEAFERRTPPWDAGAKNNPAVPDSMPEPFLAIARGCLRQESASRISIEDVKVLLANQAISAAPTGSTFGQSNPQANDERPRQPSADEPAEDAADSLPDREPAAFAPRPHMFSNLEGEEDEPTGRKGSLLLVVVVLLIAAVLAVRAFRGRFGFSGLQSASSQSQSAPQSPASQNAAEANPAAPPSSGSRPSSNQPQTAPPEVQGAASTQAAPEAPPAASPTIKEETAPKTSSGSSPARREPAAKPVTDAKESSPSSTEAENGKAAVVQQVLPNVETGASSSMERPVDVELRVWVDGQGSVSNVEYMTGGPGNYFARIARNAAKSWKFKAPVSDGRPIASQWVLLFRFDRRRVDVTATEVTDDAAPRHAR